METVEIILPCHTKVARISQVRSVGTTGTAEVTTEFNLQNEAGEKIKVSKNMRFDAGGKTLWLGEKPDKTGGSGNEYEITLDSGVKYYNNEIQSGSMAYGTKVILSIGSEVVIPAGTIVWIDFGVTVDVTLNKNVKAKII